MTLSIVMATYNRARTLPRAIASVLAQTDHDWELIVVDDGSTDETAEILAGIDDERVRVYRHEHNRGVAAAKNTGLDHLRGDWFTTLDSDDEIVPDALRELRDCARRTGANAVTCNCIDPETGTFTGIGPTRDGRLSARDTATYTGEFWGITQTALLGGLRFDERLPGYEGMLFFKIDCKARRYYLHRALRIYHREGGDRITRRLSASSLTEKARVYRVLGEDTAYLRALRVVDVRRWSKLMAKVLAGRAIGHIPGMH